MYKSENVRSIGELYTFGGRNLTVVFEHQSHPVFVFIPELEFKEIAGNKLKMIEYAIQKLNN